MHTPPPNRRTLRRRALLGTTALFLIATGVGVAGAPAYADFADGTIAYESGDYERAYNEWLPLARAGNAAAQRNIGQLYRLGLGVPKDLKVAANWYRLAADQGLSRAQANLGVMYLRGEGVERDPVRAASWFAKAAEQGHTISQYNLALMLEQGYGVPRDTRQAARWFSEAAEGGHDKASDRLASILSETVAPAAGPAPSVTAPAVPSQTARAEDYLPTRLLNRGQAPAPVPQPAAEAPVQVAAAPPPAVEPKRTPDKLTEALTARPSPATIAGTPAARFAVRPEAQVAERQIADLPASAPESTGLRRPAFLQAPAKPRREDAPVRAALGSAPEPRPAPPAAAPIAPPLPVAPRQSRMAPAPVAPTKIEVPVAPFLKAEAAATRPSPAPATATTPIDRVPVAPFLRAEAATLPIPVAPAVPVAPVQVAAVVAPPPPPLPARREPTPAALVVPPTVAPKAVPFFLQREAMTPPPGLDLIPRFGPNSYLAPRDIPVALQLDATPVVPPKPAAAPIRAMVAPPANEAPPPVEPAKLPAFLAREAQFPEPNDKPAQVLRHDAILPEKNPNPAPPERAPLAAIAPEPRIPLYYLRRSAEAVAAQRIEFVPVPIIQPDPVQIAALTASRVPLNKPARDIPVVVKPIPVFLQREAAAGIEHDETEEAVVVGDRPSVALPRFLAREAQTAQQVAEPVATLAAVNAKPVPAFLAAESAAPQPVPDLERRAILRPPAPPKPAPPAAAESSAAILPASAKPEAPAFLREEASTGALALVDTPRAGDPVGRAKRVTSLLAAAEESIQAHAPSAIPSYYRDRAALLSELEKADDDVAPLPFLRRAPRQSGGAPIQPIPDLLVAEARQATVPVQPFLRGEAAAATRDGAAPGTGGADRAPRLAARPDAGMPVPATKPSRTLESVEDRRAVDTGVAAYLGRDYAKALAAWLPAATRGNADAQFFIAGLYLDGNGLDRDLIQSHIWFARSAAQGHTRAGEQLDLLRKIMTQDQYAEAEQRRATE